MARRRKKRRTLPNGATRKRDGELNRVGTTPKFIAEVSAFEEESLSRCLAGIELSLRRRNPDEARAWIDRHACFEEPLTWESSVLDLDLSKSLKTRLRRAGIKTTGDLRAAIKSCRMFAIPNVGPRDCERCIRAIESIGKVALDWVI
jgi:hypothetical protein